MDDKTQPGELYLDSLAVVPEYRRQGVTKRQRVSCIGVFHFGPKRIPFWAKTRSILGQNAFHFGPNNFHFAAKRIPFCGKTRSILRQNAFHFAAKRISFCGKTRSLSGMITLFFRLVRSQKAAEIFLNDQTTNPLTD